MIGPESFQCQNIVIINKMQVFFIYINIVNKSKSFHLNLNIYSHLFPQLVSN